MIELKDVSKYYGTEPAVRELSLSLEAGESCAIVGPSGCGKTSLLHLSAGLLHPDQGKILIQGRKLTGPRPTTGLILQEDALLPWYTLRRNIGIGLEAAGLPPQQVHRKTERAMESIGIGEHAEKYPIQLSGGQRQRASIARTLVTDPDLLLMDEPTSALDEMTKETLQDLILRLYLKTPRTMVFVTHSIEEAVFLGRTVLVMDAGRIRRRFENPYFGDPELRDSEYFYRLVLEIRRELKALPSFTTGGTG